MRGDEVQFYEVNRKKAAGCDKARYTLKTSDLCFYSCLWDGVVRHTVYSNSPRQKLWKSTKTFQKGIAGTQTHTRGAQENMFPLVPDFCFLQHILYNTFFVWFPVECTIFWGDLQMWMAATHKQTHIHTHNNPSVTLSVHPTNRPRMWCVIRECSRLIKTSHDRAAIHRLSTRPPLS